MFQRTLVLTLFALAFVAPVAARADALSPDAATCRGRRDGDACITESGAAGHCQTFRYMHPLLHRERSETRCTPNARPAPPRTNGH